MNKSKNNCFVLMPFEDQLKEIYTEIYKPVCTELGFHCWRVDEINRPGSITKDIVQGIVDSTIIIADLTLKNSNVFYELGIAHSLNKRTIMICQKKETIPFDISNYRVIIYEHTLQGCKELAIKLKKAIIETQDNKDRYSNPVQDILSISMTLKISDQPLVEIIDYSKLNPSIVRYLFKNNIINLSDVSKIDFNDMLNTKNIGKVRVGNLVQQLIKNNILKENSYNSKFLR